jgi:hypothetical protein
MDAIVIDLKDMGGRTPEQEVRVFLNTYGPEDVRVGLWKAFKMFALASEETAQENVSDMEEMAALFDGLIGLASGIHQLREKTSGRCVICGQTSAENNNGSA